MKFGGVLVALGLMALLLSVSCGGGGTPTPAEQTLEAAIEAAENTPVERPVRQYAQQLCKPFRNFFEDAGELLESLDEEEDETDIGTALAAMRDLEKPFTKFRDDLEEIDPPDELRQYHDGLTGQMNFAAEAIKAINDGGLFAALAFSQPPPTPQEPEGLESAIVQECGEEFVDLIEEFGADFFQDETSEPEPSPQKPGTVGESISRGDFELVVHSVEDPYYYIGPSKLPRRETSCLRGLIASEKAPFGRKRESSPQRREQSYAPPYCLLAHPVPREN